MDINIIEGQITRADQFIDETIGTFQENTGIDPRDKEIATEEETEKIKDGIRRQVITITDLTPKFCKTKSGELQTKKSEVPPIVVNSFSERDWEIVIKKARKKIREENCEKLSL